MSMLPLILLFTAIGYRLEITQHALLSMLEAERARYAHLALHDDLTGLANRALIWTLVDNAIQRSRRADQTFAVLYLDLDKFKPINDRLGHRAGDVALKETGMRLAAATRLSDAAARIGGGEFAVLLNGARSLPDAVRAAEHIRDTLSEPFEVCGEEVRIGCSVGISLFRGEEQSADALIGEADASMYQAKAAGGSVRS